MIISSSTNMGLGIIVIMLLTSSLLCSSSAKLQANIDSDPCLESDYVYKPSPELPHGRFSFPQGFVFGTATSSYQIEGASNVHGKGPSVWDRFTHEFPDRIEGGGNGDVAIDHYNRFLEDIQRMKYMNVDAYRLSISWPRVIPSGRRSDGINREGIQFYHTLLDALIENEIDPYVTIWHWDTPQTIEAEYGGFLSRDIVKDYVDYCDLLFEEYGSKVTKWITLNEPMGNTGKAYDEGVFAPGRCSPWVNRACQAGDSGIEPYIVAHNLLLAHSGAYHLYKNKYKHLTAEIGITYVTHWFVPYSNETKDVDAAQRALDWMYGWFMDPITFGNYPRTMVDLLGSRLPKFTEEESRLLRKSYDFLGLNYYTGYYVKHNDDFDEIHLRYATDSHGITTSTQLVSFTIQLLGSYWQYLYPEGLRVLLEYTKETYMDPVIYITENGNEKQVKVKGYFAWSYADNFEWNEGYTVRFGLNYVNYTDLSRHPKHSACWFTNFCSKIQPKSFDLHHLFTTSSTSTSLGGRRSLSSSAGRFN
ncbi:Isoflavonoid 7-O-beta-apiosyl-glucoside beta-glycosidase [Linum perenne]